MDYNKVTEAFIAIRDKRAELRKAWQTEDEELERQQGILEGAMLRHLQDSGMESVRTTSGTFYKTEELKPSASDWTAFYAFIKDNDCFEALERRVKKDFVKAYMEDHDGAMPPGISVHREYAVRVRRA